MNPGSLNEMTLKENGVFQEIVSFSCPSQTEPERISSVLTIDISGSMKGRNMELAKLAARTWINTLNLDRSQCAVTTFDDYSYVNQDLTNNYDRLKRAVDNIKESIGGTNYEAALLDEKTGALNIVAAGLHKKVIVFLTDGTAGADTNEIIQKALDLDAVIHTIVLSIDAPDVLKSIARATGGMNFENVESVEEIEKIYKLILLDALELDPCEITWKSTLCDNLRNAELIFIPNDLSGVESYSVPDSLLESIVFSPAGYISFGFVVPGSSETKNIGISALSEINISEISPSNSSEFRIIDYGGSSPPFKLISGESRTLTVEFTPQDSAISYSKFEILSDACLNNEFFAEGGFAGIPAKDTTLKILHPDGGEMFIAGSDVNIFWDGILPSDTVSLEFSSNGGADWSSISKTAKQFKYEWKSPDITSSNCLVKGTHIAAPAEDESVQFAWYHDDTDSNSIRSIAVSPDGSKAAAAGDKGLIMVWNTSDKTLYAKKSTNLSFVSAISWHPGGKLIAAAGSGNAVKVWNIETNATEEFYPGHNGDIYALEWSPDGKRIASGGSDSEVKIWNFQQHILSQQFSNHSGIITSLSWMKPTGDMIASASRDGTVRVWITADADEIRTYQEHGSPVFSVDWGANGRIASAGEDSEIHIWEPAGGNIYHILTGHTGAVYSVKWNTDASLLASGGAGLFVRLWDPAAGNEKESFGGHVDRISSIVFSGSESIFSGSYDQTVKKWKIGGSKPLTPFVQSDVSDMPFSIVKPYISVKDVHFGKIFVNNSRDSLIQSIIVNNSPAELRVDSIRIMQGDNAFNLKFDPAPFYLKTDEISPLEISFKPNIEKIFNASLEVFSYGYKFMGNISGQGARQSVDLITDYYDFGKVPVNAANAELLTTLQNVGASPVEILSIDKTGPDSTQFLILEINGNPNQDFPYILQKGNALEMLLAFTPKQTGKTSGNIAFRFAGTGSPRIMRLYGEGIASELLAPKKISFPPVICGKTQQDTLIELTNTGSNLLTISSASFSGAGADEFIFTETVPPFDIEPDSTVYLKIRFSPEEFGIKSTTLTLVSNASNAPGGLTDIVLETEYHNVDFSVSPEHVRMENLEPAMPASTTFSIINSGTYPLKWVIPQRKGRFEITALAPNPVPPNSKASATLSFDGGETGKVYDETYSLYDTCGGRKYVFFRAVIKTNQAQILTDNSLSFPRQVCEKSKKDTLIEIKNSGETDLLIFHTKIINDFGSVFKIVSPLENDTIKPDSVKRLEISAESSEPGFFSADLEIKSNAINAEDSLNLIPLSFTSHDVSFELTLDEILIGTSFENQPDTAKFGLINTGTYPLSWEKTSGGFPFEIISIEPAVTMPDDTSEVILGFAGGSFGDDYSYIFSFTDTCDAAKTILARAKVRETPSVTIQVGVKKAKTGEYVDIPIFLRDSSKLKNSLITGYSAELKSRASVLVPVGENNRGRIENGWRYLPVELPAMPQSGNILAEIPYRAVLGENASTPIELINFKAHGGNIIRTLIPGMFSLEGLCQTGGERLYLEKKGIWLGDAYPNPANSIAETKFSILQSSEVELKLYDSFGREKMTVLKRFMNKGEHAVTLPLESLPSGVYTYVITTRYGSEAKQINVIK